MDEKIVDALDAVAGTNAALLQAAQQAVIAINNLNQTMAAVFPQMSAVSDTATAGAQTLPANPAGFISIANPVTGETVKVPFYSE